MKEAFFIIPILKFDTNDDYRKAKHQVINTE